MKQVLLSTLGSYGDIYPFIGLGIEIQKRGYQATLIANTYYEPIAKAAGLSFAQMGTAAEHGVSLRDPNLWHPQKGFDVVLRAAIESVREGTRRIEDLYRPGETVIVSHPFTFCSLIAHEKWNIPLATLLFTPILLPSLYSPRRVYSLESLAFTNPTQNQGLRDEFDLQMELILADPINAIRGEYGLSGRNNIVESMQTFPHKIICGWPEWFYGRQPDWPPSAALTGFLEYDGAVSETVIDDPKTIDFEQRPIVFTFGTAMLQDCRRFFSVAAEACLILGRQGILVTPAVDMIPKVLSPLVRHVTHIPSLGTFLNQSAAIVHHGGVGTSARALRAGIPQLTVPTAFDQFDTAYRLTELGVAGHLSLSELQPDKMAEELLRLLTSPAVAAECHRYSLKFHETDAIELACRLVDNILSTKP